MIQNMLPACLITFYTALLTILVNTSYVYASEKVINQTPKPQNVGGFLIRTTLNLEQQLTTNLRATDNNVKSDLSTAITPSIAIKKDIRDHEFTIKASSTIAKHLQTHKEDTTDGQMSLSALLTAKRSLKIPISVSYDKSHVERHKDTSVITPTEPIKVQRKYIEGGFIFAPNRLHIGIIGHYSNNRFSNNKSDINTPLIYKDSDHNNTGISGKISYNTKGTISPFLEFKTHKAEFLRHTHNGTSFNGAKRDHNYYSTLAGINIKSNTISGDIAAGYNALEYNNGSLEDLHALHLAANLSWQPTENTNLDLSIIRNIAEDNIIKTAYTENTINAELKYQALHDLSINAGTMLSNRDYTSGRDDTIYEGRIGANYTLNTAMQAHAKITSRKRDSNADDEDYMQNTLMVGITGSL
ncbi:MAG: outer membrane beta-barrel protein [Alphaproteobacteria bacterium]